jgi:hypothetical protein
MNRYNAIYRKDSQRLVSYTFSSFAFVFSFVFFVSVVSLLSTISLIGSCLVKHSIKAEYKKNCDAAYPSRVLPAFL